MRFGLILQGFSEVFSGAQSRDRTDDLMLTMHVLYQLSYLGPLPLPYVGRDSASQSNRSPREGEGAQERGV